MTADLSAAPPRPRRPIIVVGVVAVLAVAALTIYLEVGNRPRSTPSSSPAGTATTTVTYPCPFSSTTQTLTTTAGSTGSAGSGYGPLLGNFSAMNVVLYGNGTNGKWFASSSMTVLNRSSTPSGLGYEVNITTESVGRRVNVSETQRVTTTIISPGNFTSVGSELANVAENGSVVSMIRSSGNSSSQPLPLAFFAPLLMQGYSHPGSREVSASTITIGTTKMAVANWQLPASVDVIVQNGCDGEGATKVTLTTSHETVQAGQVPGTDFTLVTRYALTYSMQSNSTSPSSSEFSVTEEVTGFTVA